MESELQFQKTFVLAMKAESTLYVHGSSSKSNVTQQESLNSREDESSLSSQTSNQPEEVSKKQAVKTLNQKIKLESFKGIEGSTNSFLPREGYDVGPGDVLEIAVFQVEELNRKVRVTGDGMIMIPLLGGIRVNGMTTTEIEQFLTRKLGEEYIHDPQITVFIDEFRSQQVAVLGAVKDPGIYNIRQPRTILEMMAQAGGLSDKAGGQIQIRRSVFDPESELHEKELLVVELDVLLEGVGELQDISLRGGDSVVVPEVGSVFVEGAVVRPGAYEMRGDTNVLKVLSMAGGIVYETSKHGIDIYRETFSGETRVYEVDYERIRENPDNDIILQEGDVVVVHHSSIKRGLAGFWKGVSGIFRVGL